MSKRLSLGEFLIATQGFALLRGIFEGNDAHTAKRLREIREILDALDDPDSMESMSVQTFEVDPLVGYADWAASYDGPINPLIAAEQPALSRIIASIPPGMALDVCTGTGRVARVLADAGNTVVAVDQCREMLDASEHTAGPITYRQVPLDGALGRNVGNNFDLVTCALALTHFEDLTGAVKNLVATLRPGGHMVLTDAHPYAVHFGTQASFNSGSETPFVRNRVHQISAYLRAFKAAGLEVLECEEVTIGEGEGPMMTTIGMLRPDATRHAYLGMPLALLWNLQRNAAAD